MVLYRVELVLAGCNDSNGIGSLSLGANDILFDAGGFRRYVQTHATRFGITGTIQRMRGNEVAIKFEGTANSISHFDLFLVDCFERGYYSEQLRRSRPTEVAFGGFLRGFTILSDASCPHDDRFRPNGVISGRHSSGDYIKQPELATDGGIVHGHSASGSRSSSESHRSAGSRGSAGSRSDAESDSSSFLRRGGGKQAHSSKVSKEM